MKTTLTLFAIPVMAAMALAQDPTAPAGSQDPSRGSQSPAQSNPSNSSGQATPNQSGASGQTAAGTPAAGKSGTASNGQLAEMKTQNYSGVLVDASCAGAGGSATSTANSGSPDQSTSSSSADRNAAGNTGAVGNSAANAGTQTASANRGGADGSCTVSSSTSQFALKTKDGRMLRFDSVGNQRAQEALKNNKKWTANAGGGKSINAKVSGIVTGDQITVVTIH